MLRGNFQFKHEGLLTNPIYTNGTKRKKQTWPRRFGQRIQLSNTKNCFSQDNMQNKENVTEKLFRARSNMSTKTEIPKAWQ